MNDKNELLKEMGKMASYFSQLLARSSKSLQSELADGADVCRLKETIKSLNEDANWFWNKLEEIE